MNGHDEFYIGWESKAPAGIGSRVRRVAVFLLALAVLLGVLLALVQRNIGVSVFEWGKVKGFSGILKSQPYPHLLVPRPGASDGQTAFSSYYLVKPFKFGLDPGLAARLDGQAVGLKGTLIYRGEQTMLEVVDDSLRASDPLAPSEGARARVSGLSQKPVSLGQQTLTGEIVDSKCFLGVMNPGALTPHRACAIRCISGGIPPILLVQYDDGLTEHYLLTGLDGGPLNKGILDLVAEPVTIRGEVERQGDLLVLRTEPKDIRRVGAGPR